MYVLRVEKILPHPPGKPDRTIAAEFLVLSTLFIGASAFICVKLVARDTMRCAQPPNDPNAPGKWRNGAVLTGVLLGPIVRIDLAIPGTPQQSSPFYAASIGLMKLRWPKHAYVVA